MKFTCERHKLNEAVLNVQRTVSTKSTVPALEGILLKASQNSIQLCGYDLELGMTTNISANIEIEGSIVLSARLFGDIVRRLPADSVCISTDEKLITTIVSGTAKFSIIGISPQEYPEFPTIDSESSFIISSDTLKSMIRQTLFAVADNDAKPIHTGTLFELCDNTLRLVSVDGYRLAIREEPIQNENHFSFVVPGKTLGEVIKLLGDGEEETEILIGKRHILFTIGTYTVISRLLEGEFLDYKAAIPSTYATELQVATHALTDSIERVSLLITDRLKSPVQCSIADDEIKISCITSIGQANDQLETKMTGDNVEIGFNNRFFLDALRNSECDELKIQLNGPLSPIKILPPDGNSFLFLVLPVRLKSE